MAKKPTGSDKAKAPTPTTAETGASKPPPAAAAKTPPPEVPASPPAAQASLREPPATSPVRSEEPTRPPGPAPSASSGKRAIRLGERAVAGRPSARPTAEQAPRVEPTPSPAQPAPAKGRLERTVPGTASEHLAAQPETIDAAPGPLPGEGPVAPVAEVPTAPPQPPLAEPEVQPPEAESVHIEEPLPGEEPADLIGRQSEAHQPRYRPSLFIVQITPEMAPVAKVGGLADVVFGLTRELAIRGNHVEIVLPKYANLRYDHIYDLQPVYNDLWVPWYGGAIHCTVFFGFVHGRKCFFIEPHSGDNFFNRGSIYGFPDDVLRYAFFSRAAMEFLFKAGKHPDVIHCHDWQTALAPVFLYEIYQYLGMTHPRVCLTIHNFKHQGVTGMEVLRATGLHKPERYFDYNQLRDNHNPHALNLLKGGIVYSNFVTTVSPRYAFETKDGGQGFGLEPTLHTHHMKYGGVVNGIDYDVWNPEVDYHIPVRYGLGNIDAKYDNKRALRHRLMLADNEKPIVAFIGRLDPQKGLDLVRHAIFYTLERGGQFVLLGSSPDHGINADFWGLKRMLNDSPDCHLEIGFDEDLSHLIYAGADLILVPSRFEPCGLTQLIAMRYGTIPVVRAVGGLADTVFDKDYSNRPLHERNGYVFENYDQPGLESALGRALACYYHHPDHFRELIKNAMRYDYSWNRPGEDYLNIYDYIRQK